MKIAFLMYHNGLTGGGFAIFENAKRFRAKGHEVTLFFQYDQAPLDCSFYPGMEQVETRHLKDARDDERFDVAVATWWETAFHIHEINARNYAYFIQDLEDRFYVEPYRTSRLLVEKTYEENFHFFTSAQWLADHLERKFGKKAVCIPYALNFEWFGPDKALAPRSDRVRVLVEGPGAQPRKRIAFTFSVLSHFPELEVWYVAADGYREEGWRMERFFERVPYREMPPIYAACDFILKLSSQESFSLPVLETFASGGTAIVAAFTGHDEYIRHETNALVVPVDDRAAAIAAVRRLSTDRALLERLKAGARETCKQFSWARSNDRFEEALRSILSHAPPGPGQFEMLRDYATAYEDYEQLKRRLKEREWVIDNIYRSNTWKVGRCLTWPLRRVKQWVRGHDAARAEEGCMG